MRGWLFEKSALARESAHDNAFARSQAAWYHRFMSAQLSEELQQELAREGDRPIRVVHPGTKKMYVLLAADLYERLKPLLEEASLP